jgi:thioredoxin reductase/NAD-dependent dihydropyrimidine dehydrogenase PreA subunit
VALVVVILASGWASARAKSHAKKQAKAAQGPRVLIHSINDDRCTGCDACVAVCPTNVLDLIDNKSRVIRFQDCIQCEACMWACPTEALVMHPEGTQPPKIKQPDLDEFYQTRVQGQYLIGEVAGKPLVKNAANLGRAVVEHMLATGLKPGGLPGGVDVAIVGSGPGGLSAALTCMYHGLSYKLYEKEHLVASTIARYPKGKLIMAEPYDCQNLSFLPVFDSSKEETIPIWEELLQRVNIQVSMGEAVEAIKRQKGSFDIRSTSGTQRAQRVVLATGLRGKPRTLSVPGENQPKVASLLEDPDLHRGQAVCVVGGGDSALEAAIALADAGAKVVLSYRGRNFNRAQPKNRSTIEKYAAEKRVKVQYQSEIVEFGKDTVTMKVADGRQKTYPNQAAFVLIGADPPITWLSQLGIEYVERPHMAALGRPDALVKRFAPTALPCPDTAAAAAALVQRHSVEDELRVRPQLAESRAKKMIRSATGIFSVASRLEKPMPLSQFAKENRKHRGDGRRDKLKPGERTRMLRMLRDEGGRLADEDSQMYHLPQTPADSIVDPSMQAFGSQPAETVDNRGGRPRQVDIQFAPTVEPRRLQPGAEIHAPAGDPNMVKPKQAVIVGLAQAAAQGPRSKREAPPAPPPGQQRVEFAETELPRPPAPPRPPGQPPQAFPSQAPATLRTLAPPGPPRPPVAAPSSLPPASLPPSELSLKEGSHNEEPTQLFSPEQARAAIDAAFNQAFEESPLSESARLEFDNEGGPIGVSKQRGTSGFDEEEPTRAVDLERLTGGMPPVKAPPQKDPENTATKPKSILEVDWDID